MIGYFVYNLNSYSGASQQALLLAKYVNENILIFNHEKNIKKNLYTINNKIKVIDLPTNKLYRFITIVKYIIRYKIRILHLHGFFAHGLYIAFLLNIKVILKSTLLGSDDFDSIKKRKLWFINKLFLKKIHKNIALSNKIKEINSKYINPIKIEIIPNGVELPSIVINKKENIFCFVGLICDRKGTYESIQYYIYNYSKLEHSKMYIIGPNTYRDGLNEFDVEYVKKCYELVASNKLENQIIFTGHLKKEQVFDYFKISKALIFLSKKEGMPNVVLEAMSHNCISITYSLDGVMEEIYDKCSVMKEMILKRNDFKINIEILNSILEKKAPFLQVYNHFNIENIAKKYKDFYEF
ncbi:glycosyltransferase family 4 protein [Aliarcobacter cryaerophilus]|uniref:glycosyltransferase family 4 protein n=1 Tax=Aliarcobacter cryaerophilus TaxID=28198 RepID=UPI0021B6BCE1|nr:glycosyltransferase family 4 protein [Aliarcobacter cryaerophilus]MCT7492527.1 glycosyltransferase family 4 protein [Aliarcobacter cryaerophilus]